MSTPPILSTMWAMGRFADLPSFFDAARGLGFTHFELNHAVTSAMLSACRTGFPACPPLDGLESLSYDKLIPSIHEPCPADVSAPVLKERNWLVSATDEEKRRQGVAAVRRSIELAYEIGASVVIVHPGRVDIDPSLEATAIRLYGEGKSGGPEYALAKEKWERARAVQAPLNMASVRRSLLELAEHAARRGLRLGLENRYHYYEIPLPDELDELLNLGDGDVLGYWHDTGHAQVLEHLGFVDHEEWLRCFGSRIIGVHLHDVRGLHDHKAAGQGQVDWDMVASYVPARALRTCEYQFFNTPEEVAASVKWLADHLQP